MENRTKVMITFFSLIFLIFGMYIFTDWFSKVTGYVMGEDEKIKLANCLSNKGAVYYITENCALCEEEKEIWGKEAIKLIQIYECKTIDDCPNLPKVPVWRINGKFHLGENSLQEIKKVSNC